MSSEKKTKRETESANGESFETLTVDGLVSQGKNKQILSDEVNGRAMAVFKNSYVVNTGQVAIPVVRTVYVVAVSSEWPELAIVPRNPFSWVMYRFGWRRGLQLENESFNRAFRIKTKDEDFAITLLSPELQRFLVTKRNVTWRIKNGRLALIYSGSFKKKKLLASQQRLQQFLDFIPPEFEAWENKPEKSDFDGQPRMPWT